MVLDYYNLKEQPFGVTPDPRYFYLSGSHREALASLLYGIRNGRGFMSLIAKPGMGKTTVLFKLLNQLQDSARTVFLFQTLCGPKDLLRGLLRDLGVVDDDGDAVRMQERLNDVLLEEARRRRRVVVVVDEAQNLEDSALELLRMLSNFETSSEKLMQIIVSGQPQLREKLASPELLQLRQRMSMFARLQPFTAEDVHLYIRHRLSVAGYDCKTPLFTPGAESLIAKYSQGIPRNINNICFNALSIGCALKQETIRREAVEESLSDLDLTPEAVDDRGPESACRKVVPVGAPAIAAKSAALLASGSWAWNAWRRPAAVCALLLPLVSFTGDWRDSGGAAHGPPTETTQIVTAASANNSNSASSSTHSVARPLRLSVVLASAPGPESQPQRRVEQKSEQKPAQKSEKRTDPPVHKTTDPSALWAQVKNKNSDAAVDLARLYLEGTAVPKNCAQAKVLLESASRRGNPRADDALNGSDIHSYDQECQ